jgi:hypothetical protein
MIRESVQRFSDKIMLKQEALLLGAATATVGPKLRDAIADYGT